MPPRLSSSSAEPSKAGADSEPSLGKTLAAARERRGVSRADVVAETRIPAHYLEMIESSDYGLISDQLYLMPFLRRYAAFLNLDGEEVAMRFVREVQRAEVAAVPRMSEPLAMHDRKRAPWGRVAAVIVVLSAIVVLYIIASEHHRGEFGSPSVLAAGRARRVERRNTTSRRRASADGRTSTDDSAGPDGRASSSRTGPGSCAAARNQRRWRSDGAGRQTRAKRLLPRARPHPPTA